MGQVCLSRFVSLELWLISGALRAVSTTAPAPLTHSLICPSALPTPPSWLPWGTSGSSPEGLGLNESRKNGAVILCFHTEAVGNLLNSVTAAGTAAGTAKYATASAKPHLSLCLALSHTLSLLAVSHISFAFTVLSLSVCQSLNCSPFYFFLCLHTK